MPLSKEHKAQTRERILKKAGALFRRDGVDGVSVPGLMKEAGLTHGGFYAHFASKDALVAEIVKDVLGQTSKHLVSVAQRSKAPAAAVIDEYVSRVHRDHPEAGCVIASLGAETARGDDEIRRAMSESVKDAMAQVGEATGLSEGDGDEVLALYAGMVGALVLARACGSDKALSDRILEVSKAKLKESFAR